MEKTQTTCSNANNLTKILALVSARKCYNYLNFIRQITLRCLRFFCFLLTNKILRGKSLDHFSFIWATNFQQYVITKIHPENSIDSKKCDTFLYCVQSETMRFFGKVNSFFEIPSRCAHSFTFLQLNLKLKRLFRTESVIVEKRELLLNYLE